MCDVLILQVIASLACAVYKNISFVNDIQNGSDLRFAKVVETELYKRALKFTPAHFDLRSDEIQQKDVSKAD